MMRVKLESPSLRRWTSLTAFINNNNNTTTNTLLEGKRFSFKYATHSQMDEMRQPDYIHDKRYGVFSNERNVAKSRRGLPHITPMYRTHMNLWDSDTDASNNRFFRSYVFGQRELHLLLGRPHGFEADLNTAGQQGYSNYELNTDMRYKGAPRSAMTNLHFEREWAQTLYRNSGNKEASALNNPRSPFTEEILGNELLNVRDIKSLEHCQAWFDRLQYLIKLHYDAVGEIGPFRSRHTQHVHTFFMAFYDALSSFDFQDHYLFEHFHQCRPKALEDLFGIFIEMEANYVHHDYCPRCSLSLKETRYCGEGEPDTPFRKHRGRWAPHQKWGREWYDVVVRRAEALWYRSTEDPYFGLQEHTQRQAEALLTVYVRTKQRGKAIDFLHQLRGSREFLLGRITITPAMQQAYETLLDETPHPHLLTNAYQHEEGVSQYTQDRQAVPLSPVQVRLDLEQQKWRRQQKEEGVVRVPPAGWTVDTSTIVPYKIDPKTRHITNWREVKKGIEESFLKTGLPEEAYTSLELKELLALRHGIASRGARRAALESQLRSEKEEKEKSKVAYIVFPDRHWFRVFETSPEVMKKTGLSASGAVFTAVTRVFPDPAAVAYTDESGTPYQFNTTNNVCRLFGDYESGEVIRLTNKEKETFEAVVIGVNELEAEADRSLYVYRPDTKKMMNIGKNCNDIFDQYTQVEPLYTVKEIPFLAALKTVKEEVLGQAVGVRHGQLYVQWRLTQGGGGAAVNKSVATPIDNLSNYKIKEVGVEPLEEPPTWRTPFRNDFLDERLKEVEQAPFSREKWASLIEGKYTPKEKIFGYTQHNKNDDFETKEYKDRLLSRQYFHRPQAFEILPEKQEKSVLFRGKEEFRQVGGLPTVDRNELEKGFDGTAAVISEEEEKLLEQALRDISGRRPGNFIKSKSEVNQLHLNESWWESIHYGWEEHNKEMKILNDPTEQQFIESNKLPFKGSIPVFGTSYGIGERIRGIVEDYTKGFGLGPHGHSPSSDKYHWDSFSNEARRTDTLTLENVLVRLFNEKLAAGQSSKDEYQWGLEMVSWMSQNGQEMNVQSLLLSLREWREAGRKPSLLLSRVLKVYLKDEIALFNESLPAGVPRLTIANTYRHEDHHHHSSDGRLWEETDPLQYKLNYYKASSQNRLHSEEPYLQTLILEAQQKNLTSTSDNAYQNYVSQTLIQQFSLDVAALVGKDIPTNVVEARTQANNGSHARNGGNVAQLVRVSHLAHLLEKYGVTTQSIFFVLRGLAECPEQQALEQHNNKEMGKFKIANDFAVPVSLILTWTGPQGTNTGGNARKHRNQNNNNTSNTNNIMATLRKDASAKGNNNNNNSNNSNVRDKVVFHVLEELALSQDGTATDILYAMRQNKKNPTLKQEFITAFLPAFNHDLAKTTHTYQEYMEGRYVPNINVAFEVFADFLKKAATEMKFENSPFLQTYFEVDYHPYHVNLLSHAKLKLLPLTEGPFHYENSLVEQVETVDRFNQYHITAGLTQVPMTGFIISDSKSMNYFLNRKNDVAHVTQTNDHHLLQFIQQQSFYKEFMTNRKNDTTHPLHYLFFTLQQGAGIISSFHRYFYRVAPMLSFYENVLNTYGDNNQNNNNVNLNKNNALRQILNADKNTSMELEFRRNAERYWRGVMDGKNMEENILPTRNNNHQNNNNNNNGFNPRQHGRNNNNHQNNNKESSNLSNILFSKKKENNNNNENESRKKKSSLENLLPSLKKKN